MNRRLPLSLTANLLTLLAAVVTCFAPVIAGGSCCCDRESLAFAEIELCDVDTSGMLDRQSKPACCSPCCASRTVGQTNDGPLDQLSESRCECRWSCCDDSVYILATPARTSETDNFELAFIAWDRLTSALEADRFSFSVDSRGQQNFLSPIARCALLCRWLH